MTDKSITDLHFINSQEGWAVTPQRRNGGYILHTVDGGEYWKTLAKTNQSGVAIHFVDSQSGWVLMGNGVSLTTADGGLTWKRRTSNIDGRIRRVKFHDHTHAWGIGGGGAVLTTRDQGRSWERLQLEEEEEEDEGEADWFDMLLGERDVPAQPAGEADSSVLPENRFQNDEDFAGNFQQRRQDQRLRPGRFSQDEALAKANENAEPTTQNQEIRNERIGSGRPRGGRRGRGFGRGGGAARFVKTAHFLNDQKGWVVGNDAHIHHTTNGGQTWERQLGSRSLDNLRDVLFLSGQQGWVAGENGFLIETQDGGKTWQTLQVGTQQTLVGVHFPSLDPKWGWSMQRDGTVLYTTDGIKWSSGQTPMRPPVYEEDFPIPFAINDVAFGKFSEGWAVGRDGQIIHNQDGGPIWTAQRTSTNANLINVEMKFAPLGWAVGDAGIVQRTINGGEYWRHHETDTGYSLNAVSFITKRKGWAVGRYGIVLRTTDGGFEWEAIPSNVTQELYNICVLSEQEIYAVGATGTIIHSMDGGDTWEQEHTDIANDLYAIVKAENNNELWIVGQWGVILRREIDSIQMSIRKTGEIPEDKS